MDLDILDPVFRDQILQKFLGYHAFIDNAPFDPHGEQAVRIAAEGLAVHKVSPAADDLPGHKAETGAVRHGQE